MDKLLSCGDLFALEKKIVVTFQQYFSAKQDPRIIQVISMRPVILSLESI